MKKYIFAIIAALILISCKDTNENLVQERGVYAVPVLSNVNPAIFLPEMEDSYVSFDLSLPPGEKVDKVELEVVFGNKSAILKEVTVTETGVKVTVTPTEIHRALNVPDGDYDLGNTYYLYVLTTQNGTLYRSTTRLTIPVLCPFEEEMLVGNFYFIDEDGDDGYVTIEADPDNPYKVYITDMADAQGLTGNGNPIELTVNRNNYSVTGPKSIIAANTLEWDAPYTNFAFEPVSTADNVFNACDNSYTIVFELTVSQGSFGKYEFVFTKVE